jgi:hypothetical protein
VRYTELAAPLAVLLLCFALLAEQKTAIVGDEHVPLCHADFLRFYRVHLTERNQRGVERKVWTGWRLISDAKADEKEQYEADMKFYRENKIEVQFAAVEAKLPE